MSLKFNCPKCNKELIFKYLKKGEKGNCQYCHNDIFVPPDAVEVDKTPIPEPINPLAITSDSNNAPRICRIKVKRISNTSLFKLLIIGYSIILIPFIIFCGILSIGDGANITLQDKPITGLAGLAVSFILGPALSLWFAFITWLILVSGLWVYSQFKNITISYFESEEQPHNNKQ